MAALTAAALALPALVARGAMPPAAAEPARDAVIALGPWPPAPPPRDPANPKSGDRLAIQLGQLLFRDPRMSPVGYIACVTCHQPDRAFTDTRRRAHGIADLPRNTPTLANLRLHSRYGWQGSRPTLREASLGALLDPREIDGDLATVTRMFQLDADLARCYRSVFRASPLALSERTLANVGNALAAFVETLTTERTPFDDYRDALARGDVAVTAAYPAAARRGLADFVGAAGCVACHRGANFSDGALHPLAAAPALPLRTPSLRNVAVTAPYLHDGRADTLRQAIEHLPRAEPLGAARVADLEAFLRTLTDRHGERRPWAPTELHVRCR